MKKLTVLMTRTETILGLIYLAYEWILLPIILVVCNLLLGEPLSESQINFLYFLLNFLFVVLFFYRFLKASFLHTRKNPFRCFIGALQGFALYYVSGFLLGILIASFAPDYANLNDQSIGSMAQDSYALIYLGTVILVPIAEEVFFRGILFGRLYGKNRFWAYFVSSALFSLIHISGYITLYDPISIGIAFVQYLPAGIFLAWAYTRADSIFAPILMHMTINQIALLAMR